MKKSSILAICLVICMINITKTQDVGDGFNKKFEPSEVKNQTTQEQGVDVSFNFIDAPLMDILWCGENKSTIFVLSEKSTLYRSTNDGFSGHKLTDHLEKLGKKELEGTSQEVGTVSRMVPSPVDPNLILFLGTEGINWITQDCGTSIKAMNQGRRVEEIQFHPTEKTWMLAYAWTTCEDFVGEPCRKYKELFLTKDLGESWEYLANYVYQFSWGMPDALNFRVPKERVIIAHEPHARGHQNFGDWSEKLYVSYSDDFFNHSDILVKGGNKFLLTQNFLFVVQVIDEDEDEVVLLAGNSREKKYKHLRPIDLPVKHLREHSYTILDTSEHAVFLHINHEGDKSKYGNIYVSDSTGTRFNLALQGNVRDIDGQCDFERVQGLEGIYLANIYDKEMLSKHKSHDTSSMNVQGPGSKKTIETEPGRAKPTSGNAYSTKSFETSLDDFKQTVVSFDKGGMWKFLRAPDRDSENKRITCDAENCHLHLHSISDPVFGPFYSTANSMGLILGTGNVGEYLSNRADETNTYLSRDGGNTWNEIAKGSHIYDIGDHGSIIVIAPDQYATTEVQYSWNEGQTWHTLQISDEPVEIRNIIIEPSNTAEKFIIYGRTTDSPRKGFMAAIDFTPLHQRWCTGIENPDTPESDYETWTPNGFVSAHCLLGRRTNYIRKKRAAECFNSEEHERWSIQEYCECTEEDWECDFGFYRKELASPCVSQDGKEVNTTAPEECPDYYFITQGYRKIAGDTCVGGISHEPIKVSCPGGPIGSSNLVVFGLIVTIVLGLVWVNKKGNYDRLKDGFAEVVNTVLRSINKKSNPHSTGSGWVPIREYPDQGKNDDDDLNHIVFEENEENPEVIEDSNLLEVAKGKKKAEGGLKAATKQVPLLNKPSSKKNESDLGV